MAQDLFFVRRRRPALAFAALCFLTLAGCAGAGSAPDAIESPLPEGARVLGEFVARVSPKDRTIAIRRAPQADRAGAGGPGLSAQDLSDLDVVADGVPGSGPGSTVELVTNSVSFDDDCPPGFQTDTFCASVTLNHFFDRSLSNTFVQVTSVQDTEGHDLAGHAGVGGDASQLGLDASQGLWEYTAASSTTPGMLGQSPHNGATRDWTFANPDGADTSIGLRVVSSLTYSDYTFALSFRSFIDACAGGHAYELGTPNVATAELDLPFPFTLYGTTATTVRVYKRGILTFGGASFAPPATPVALPSGAASTPKPAVFAFWDDLDYDPDNGKLCSVTTGSRPNRRHVITWHDMTFASGAAGTPAHLTFSVVLDEGSDAIDLNYDTMSGPSLRAIGAGATVGVQNASGTLGKGSFQVAQFGSDTAFSFFPQP